MFRNRGSAADWSGRAGHRKPIIGDCDSFRLMQRPVQPEPVEGRAPRWPRAIDFLNLTLASDEAAIPAQRISAWHGIRSANLIGQLSVRGLRQAQAERVGIEESNCSISCRNPVVRRKAAARRKAGTARRPYNASTISASSSQRSSAASFSSRAFAMAAVRAANFAGSLV